MRPCRKPRNETHRDVDDEREEQDHYDAENTDGRLLSESPAHSITYEKLLTRFIGQLPVHDAIADLLHADLIAHRYLPWFDDPAEDALTREDAIPR